MSLMPGLDIVVANLNVSFETLMLVLFGLGGLIFYAKDVKLGLVLHMLIYGGLFMWFYTAGYEWAYPLILFFIFMVLLALSLYAVHKASQNPFGVT